MRRRTGRGSFILGVWIVLVALGMGGCNGLRKMDFTTLGRDTWQRPADVVAVLRVQSGAHVADLGAGDGYFVEHLSRAVGPDGKVFAVEIETDLVDALAARYPPESTNVEPTLGAIADPGLPDGGVDLVLLVNTYHHIDERVPYFEALAEDLAPGGRVAIVDMNEDLDGLLSWFVDEGHHSSQTEVTREMGEAGYTLLAAHDLLAMQIFMVFGRSEAAASGGLAP